MALLSVKNEAVVYFGAQDTALTWLKTPQAIFGNQTPLSYLDTMTGIEYVRDLINRLKHGMTASLNIPSNRHNYFATSM
ncbi:MAG: putative toxin-antitoxin system antitoxin component (TIGR02293 family) [Alteromonadaceae bacterium]